MSAPLRHRAALLLTLVVMAVVLAAGQARDATRAPVSTASISGTVWSTDEPPVPVPDARVMLNAVDGSFGTLTVSDDRGRFVFRDLPSGRFDLETSKPAWLGHAYGASRPGRQGTAIALAETQALADVRVALTRGAVVSGVVRDERGRPVADASIDVFQFRWIGERVFESVVPGGPFRSDDVGAYRVYGLPPGESYVLASTNQTTDSQAPVRAMETGETERIRRSAQQLGSVLTAPLNVRRPSAPVAVLRALAPSFFPSSASPATAVAVPLVAGAELPGIDIMMPLVQATRVTGLVTTPAGAPSPDAVVTIARVDDGARILGEWADLRIERPDQAGRLNLTNVFPGAYIARARVIVDPPATADGTERRMAGSQRTTAWAEARFVADGRDVDISLRLQPSMMLSGRAVFEGTRAIAPAPRLAFVAVDDPLQGPPVAFRAEAAISVPLAGWSYRLSIGSDGSPWTVTSATIRGRDILDTPVLLAPGESIDDLIVRLTDRPTRLTGTLSGLAGDAAKATVIVVFAVDRGRWRPHSRWIRADRPAADGVFEVAGLPPGDYLLAAVTDAYDGEWFAPAFLDALVPGAVRVTITDGQTTTQNLRVGR